MSSVERSAPQIWTPNTLGVYLQEIKEDIAAITQMQHPRSFKIARVSPDTLRELQRQDMVARSLLPEPTFEARPVPDDMFFAQAFPHCDPPLIAFNSKLLSALESYGESGEQKGSPIVKGTAAHEYVHLMQYRTHPEFFKRSDRLSLSIRQLERKYNDPTSSTERQRIAALLKHLNLEFLAGTILREGQARAVQRSLFPDSGAYTQTNVKELFSAVRRILSWPGGSDRDFVSPEDSKTLHLYCYVAGEEFCQRIQENDPRGCQEFGVPARAAG